jgi:hypothetical protein
MFDTDNAVIDLNTSHDPFYAQTSTGAIGRTPRRFDSAPISAPSTVYLVSKDRGLGGILYALLGLIVFLGGFYYFTELRDKSWEEIQVELGSLGLLELPSFLEDLLGTTQNRIEIKTIPPLAETKPTPEAVKKPETPIAFDIRAMKNHYEFLATSNVLPTEALNSYWSKINEDNWRSGLEHEFEYQRLRTVKEIRASRLRGSEMLLVKALDQPKFWTRMEAAIGLAEFGYGIPLRIMKKIMAGERPYLVRNYFKRFLDKPTPGALYVMRQALPLIDGKGKVIILDVLNRLKDKESKLYFIAAHFDKDPHVQNWLKEEKISVSLTDADWERFYALAKAEQSAGDIDDRIREKWPAPGKNPLANQPPVKQIEVYRLN